MANRLDVGILKLCLYILLALSLLFSVLAASANYGQGSYNSGIYGKADPSSDSSTTSSSTTSSTGGGGGVPAGSQAAPAESSSQLWADASSGQTLTMKIKSEAIAIKQVETSVNNDLKNVEVTVEKLSEEPKNAEPIETKTYQFFDIKTKNIKEEDVENVVIRFEVTKSWINANEISEKDVVLAHYKNLKWEELPTIIIKDSLGDSGNNAPGNVVKYEATAESFSYFAISIKKDALIGSGAVLNGTCRESWECTEWSNCEEGNQERACSDKNFCNTTIDRPAESKQCSSIAEGSETSAGGKKAGFGKILFWALIAAGILVFGAGSYYIYQKYSDYILGDAQKSGRLEATAVLRPEDAAKLNDYIIKCLSRGFSLELIEKRLLSVGWPKDIIDGQILEIITKYKR